MYFIKIIFLFFYGLNPLHKTSESEIYTEDGLKNKYSPIFDEKKSILTNVLGDESINYHLELPSKIIFFYTFTFRG